MRKLLLASETSTRTEGRSAAIPVNAQQQSRIRDTIIERHVQPVTNVDFDISVGTAVPMTVTFYDLPPRVIRIVPRYRGYKFFMVRDEIVIVDPRTYEIVAVIPA